jgi:cytochrome c553
LALALAGAAQAQTSDALNLRSTAASCAQCHGTDGRSAPGSTLPPIAGMPRDYLAAQLKAFKAGSRPSTIMGQLAKGFSDAQLEQLADYFSQQK